MSLKVGALESGYIVPRSAMTDLQRLSSIMRSDWDRRIQHDYRFWMSDGVGNDAAMWSAGERDFKILTDGIPNKKESVFLEIGCGVGRLLKFASSDFGKVIGLDVSEKAISKAKEFLTGSDNVELICGNGIDLREVKDHSVDVVVSFAALTSMPTEVIAQYLLETRRVIKDSGSVRLQMYIGEEQLVAESDTLHLRCFTRENFIKAAEGAGFNIQWIRELVLPFQVSFKEIGIEAFIISLTPNGAPKCDTEALSKILLPKGEAKEGASEGATTIEFWMTYNYAKDLVASGDMDKARRALEHAASLSKATTIDVSDLLQKILKELDSSPKTAFAPATEGSSEILEQNVQILKKKFPEVWESISPFIAEKRVFGDVETNATPDGITISYRGQCLDHPEKPVAAGSAWAKRLLNEARTDEAKHIVVFGLGAGYHLSELKKQTDKKLSVFEPITEVFVVAVRTIDLREILSGMERLWVGDFKAKDFDASDAEIAVRPQHQSVADSALIDTKRALYGKRGLKVLHPTVGVLGPLQGGTLPIAGYTCRALGVMHQKTRELDVSGFASGYHIFEGLVKDKVRQQVLQSNYIEMISQSIFASLSEKPVDILICMAQAPVTPKFLTEVRKLGIVTVLWFMEDYLRFTYWQQLAQYFDFVFTIQKGECVDLIKKAGAGEVHYLPMACDPGVHRQLELTEEEKAQWGSPISFVGAGYHNRQQMFASLAEMPFKIWGTEWPGCRPFDSLVQAEGRRITPDEYVKIFNGTDINLNLHSSTERDGVDPYGDFINPRTFELASCGAFQLCDTRLLLDEVFEPGKEIVTFENVNDLKDKIKYYLAHPEERRSISERATARVHKEHTYAHRIQEMLQIIYASKFEQLKSRAATAPWAKMMQRAAKHPELHDRCQKAFERGEEPILDGLISDIVTGKGNLSETEQKLLFLFHIRKQIIRMKAEENGDK